MHEIERWVLMRVVRTGRPFQKADVVDVRPVPSIELAEGHVQATLRALNGYGLTRHSFTQWTLSHPGPEYPTFDVYALSIHHSRVEIPA